MTEVARRLAQAVRVAREDGVDVLLGRTAQRSARRWLPALARPPLALADVVRTEGRLAPLPRRRAVGGADALLIDFVMTPPARGSGGHTTIFRVVEGLERRGHTCRLSLYDHYRGDVRQHRSTIRQHWPGVRARVHNASRGLLAADAVVATSWETAHVVARRAAVGERLYFVQDHEPDFHPSGSERWMAEATYRFGFRGITIGRWLAEMLQEQYGMECDWFDFGCDTETYKLLGSPARRGVVFYAKPDVPRRAFWLGALALEEFAASHPEQDIHLFGSPTPRLGFRHTHHGTLPPTRLNALYNTCLAGLSLSLTNVSLVPWELLAAGCTPVVNDAEHNRRVLDNQDVVWSGLSPSALAASLDAAVEGRHAPEDIARRSASVQGAGWDVAAVTFDRVLRTLLREDSAPRA